MIPIFCKKNRPIKTKNRVPDRTYLVQSVVEALVQVVEVAQNDRVPELHGDLDPVDVEADLAVLLQPFLRINLEYFFHIKTWGPCYDHNFLRFLSILGEKMAFVSKTNVMIKLFAKTSSSLSKKTPIFSLNFSAKIF
jgi:hypothetical protein